MPIDDQPPPTADQPPPTADQPPPTADQPPPAADQPDEAANQPSQAAQQPNPAASRLVPTAFDLQAHSIRSDGALAPKEVVATAAREGVRLLALTDHDTLAGVPEALAAGAKHGVEVVPAIEISSIDDGGHRVADRRGHGGADSVGDSRSSENRGGGEGSGEHGNGGHDRGSPRTRELHILGYRVDHTDPALQAALERFLGDREQRTLRMADNLRAVGFELDTAKIDARVAAGEPIGRPHLAEAVLAARANAQRLQAEGIDDVGSLIRGYLIEGKAAFALRQTPTVAEAIEAIHAAGGVAIWAHPFWDVEDPDEVLAMVDRFRALGIDGVEAFYATHTREQTELLARRCEELGLLSTGSADFHGPENRLFSRFLAFETYGLLPNLGPISPNLGPISPAAS